MAGSLSVLIVDEQPIVRWALRNLFSSHNIEVVGEADNTGEAARLMRSTKPDVVIMELRCSEAVGTDAALRFVESNPCQALAFTTQDTWDCVEAFLRSGGLGFVSKRSPLDELLPAVEAVARGRQWISPDLRAPVHRENGKPQPPQRETLTSRELQVAELIAKGLTSKQIADQLCVSLKTVEAHRYKVFKKLQIRRSAQLVEYVLRKRAEPGTVLVVER